MSEIINLASKNPDTYVYQEAVEILCKELEEDYSFIIQVWNHDKAVETRYPKVFISTSDEVHAMPAEASDDSYVHIFKQYAPMADMKNPVSVLKTEKVSPLPLCSLEGFVNQDINISDRKYDWSWMGQFDPYSRVHFKNSVSELEGAGHQSKVLWYNGWNNGEPIDDYCSVMNNTKIALVPTGSASYESFRFFEAAQAGCVIISQQMPFVPMYNVAPNIIVDNSWSNLTNIVDKILASPEEMEYYSKASRMWYEHFCSPKGLASYMAKRLK